MPRFCACSDDSVFELYDKWDTELGRSDIPHIYKELLKTVDKNNGNRFKDLCEINKNVVDLIEWCTDFLIYKRDFEEDFNKLSLRSNHEDCGFKGGVYYNTQKYITLYSFIYDFLKIPDESGYEYWLMNILDWYKISEHGSGIRCSWFNRSTENPYRNRILSKKRKDVIEKWIREAPDDV